MPYVCTFRITPDLKKEEEAQIQLFLSIYERKTRHDLYI